MDLLEIVNSPLSGMCQKWMSLIKEAGKVKYELFGQFAEECAKFYDAKNHNFMWDESTAGKQGGFLSQDSFGSNGFPYFRMTVNKFFEAVALFGPALYHRNPNITVQPKLPPIMEPADLGMDPNDPVQAQALQAVMTQQQMDHQREITTGQLCEHYLNWLQLEADKKIQSRRAINDAIVKGLGILWTEVYTPPNSKIKYPRSTYISCDDVVKDPDARYAEDVQWIARKCVHPVNLVEEKYGFKPGSLRGTMQSMKSRQGRRAKNDRLSGKKDSKSFDLIEYWEVYSKNGAGQFLKDYKKDGKDEFDLEVFGKHCYLAVCDDLAFPLNIPPDLVEHHQNSPTEETAGALREAAAWPIPFWEDDGCNNGWPCVELGFYESTDHIWPIPLCKPALGEIKFVNWCLSFLADKAAASCKTYLGVMKEAAEGIKQQLQGQNGPFSLIEISQLTGKPLKDIISYLDAPKFDTALWDMVAQVMELIDKRTGLTELIYGLSGRQMRSAEEARIKNDNTTIRPDEMASRVEDWLSYCAMKEMEAAVWAGDPQDFLPVFGQTATSVWVQNVFTGEDFYERLVRNFVFRVEAGSARKPNKANKADQLNQLGSIALPTIQQFALAGVIEPWNAFMRDYADALDLDATPYLLQAPPPPPEQPAGETPEQIQQQHEMELQKKQQDMELSGAKAQQEMQLKQQKFEQDAALQAMKLQMDGQTQAVKLQQDGQVQAAKLQQDAAMSDQKMQLEAKKTQDQTKIAALQAAASHQVDIANIQLQRELNKQKKARE